MIATENSAGVSLGGESEEPSSEVKNYDISGPTKRTDYMKFLKMDFINCLHHRTVRWIPGCRRTRVAGDSSSGSSCTCYHPQCSCRYTGWGRTGLSHSHSQCLVNEWMNEWMNEWRNQWLNKWTNKLMYKWMNEDEEINEWMSEEINERETNEWMKERISYSITMMPWKPSGFSSFRFRIYVGNSFLCIHVCVSNEPVYPWKHSQILWSCVYTRVC